MISPRQMLAACTPMVESETGRPRIEEYFLATGLVVAQHSDSKEKDQKRRMYGILEGARYKT